MQNWELANVLEKFDLMPVQIGDGVYAITDYETDTHSKIVEIRDPTPAEIVLIDRQIKEDDDED